MTTNQRKRLIDNYCFFIKGEKNLYVTSSVIVDFRPQIIEESEESTEKKEIMLSIIPTFNNDGKVYTPCFLLPFCQKDDAIYSQKYNKKRQSHEEINSPQIMVAKPRKKDYCHVCQINFKDYLDHSRSPHHQQSIQENKYHRRILRMSRKFNRKYNREKKKLESEAEKIEKEEQSLQIKVAGEVQLNDSNEEKDEIAKLVSS